MALLLALLVQEEWAAVEDQVRKILTVDGPFKGIEAAKECRRVRDEVLDARYPALRFYTARHRTWAYEYPYVRSLAVVDAKGKCTVVIDYLFSADDWPQLLARLAGACAEDRKGADELTAALGRLLGRLMIADWEPKPAKVESRDGVWESPLHEDENWHRLLRVRFDESWAVKEIRVDLRRAR